MSQAFSRRDLFGAAPWGLTSAGILFFSAKNGALGQAPTTTTAATAVAAPWAGFPREDLKLVNQVVGLSHRDEAGVKELVKAHPALVNAWWDWGFGDWESALGAASHVGERGIAEFLIERGARIDIFAAAMLGMTEVVKAFVTAQPGVQRTLGPHGIPLLAHAEAGGERAADTLAYLQSLGDAGKGYEVTPLPEDRKDAYVGKFASEETGLRAECRLNMRGRLVVDLESGATKATGQMLHYLGEDEFFPSGVHSVRFKFDVQGAKAQSLAILAKGMELKVLRVSV
jgi:hypothetical protein